jgi:hypothetical protein
MSVEKDIPKKAPEKGSDPSPGEAPFTRWKARIREKVLQPWLAALLFSITFGVILYLRYPGKFDSYTSAIPQDFGVYVKAWQRYVQGVSPYVANEFLAFKYSPGMLALIGVLPKAPTDAWFAFSTLCVAMLTLSLMIGARYRTWRDVVALMIGVVLAWKGIIECFDYGQVEVFIFPVLIIATSIYTRYTLLAGALIGMLPWIKAPLLFMIVPFVIASSRREREDGKPPLRRLKLFVSGFLFSSVFWGAGLPSLAFGPDRALKMSQDWFELLKSQPSSLFSTDINQSLWASVSRWLEVLHPSSAMLALGVAGILGGLLLGLLILRRPYAPTAQDSFVWITPWLIMGQLVNPLSWRWGSVYLVGAAFAAFRPGRRFLWFRGLLWLGVIGLFLFQQNPFVKGVLGLSHWTELHESGVITLYWVVLLLLSI